MDIWRLWSCNQGRLFAASSASKCRYFDWCLSSYSGSRWEQKFEAACGVLTMVLLLKVSSPMLLTTDITLLILILKWQQTMSRQYGSEVKENLNQCSVQQIMAWFKITWQSSNGTRYTWNILTSTFGLKLPPAVPCMKSRIKTRLLLNPKI